MSRAAWFRFGSGVAEFPHTFTSAVPSHWEWRKKLHYWNAYQSR